MSLEPGGIGLFSDIFLFSLCLIFTGILIFILIYFIITLSDLECDYLNAEECCGKLNFWNTPKLWMQFSIEMMLVLCGQWILSVINLPICVFLGRRFYNIPRGNIAEYDAAEIHNCGMLRKHLIGVTAHLGWQMVGFFLFLYSLLDAVMREPVNMGQDDVTVLNRPASSGLYQTLHPPSIAGDDEM